MSASRDTLILGGGIMGLAIALALRQRGASVAVLERDGRQAAARAAAGMLAPQAEGIPPSPMRDLCLESRSRYPDWIRWIEGVSGIDTGYWPCGFLAPAFDAAGERGPPAQTAGETALWLDREAIGDHQPGLGEAVTCGWWYPEDAQVDNLALMRALRGAAQQLGVELCDGVRVEAIQRHGSAVTGVRTSAGEFAAEQYVAASGAWMRELLPLPVRPLKGQMLALQMPEPAPFPLQQVLFGPDAYIVPRRDGRALVGATVEDVGWQPQNTPAGIRTLLERAARLYPALDGWSFREQWWGYRPATPDRLPILGRGPADNLYVAAGHFRNGILLAPVTAEIVADLALAGREHPLLAHFRYDRFSPSRTSQSLPEARPSAKSSNGRFPMMATPSSPPSPTEANGAPTEDATLTVGGRTFRSRLMTGTGKFPDADTMRASIAASGAQIVTVAVRRVREGAPGHQGLVEALDWTDLWMLPNTAGCQSADEAVRVARLGREMAKIVGQQDNTFVKLEVVPDPQYLLPDPVGTLWAAEQLVAEGFTVLPYINADPVLARQLQDAGCATVMPLGSPIGSGQGIRNVESLQIIIEQAQVPVVVDAGIGAPSEAAQAMELGADALLINSAIARAQDPVAMGQAMNAAIEAGRLAYQAGRIPVQGQARASSPAAGVPDGNGAAAVQLEAGETAT